MAAAQSPPLVSKTLPLRTLCSLFLMNRIISCLVNSSIPSSHPPSLTRGINSSILLALVGAALMKMSVS